MTKERTVLKFSACCDCYQYAANGSDALDGIAYYSGAEHAAKVADAVDGLAEREGGEYVTAGENISDFSWWPCEVCRSPLGGSRHEVILIIG